MRDEAIRSAWQDDAAAIAGIFAPIVRDTTISFEWEPPSVEEMRARIETTLAMHAWLVSEDGAGAVDGYAHASRHRDAPSYQWLLEHILACCSCLPKSKLSPGNGDCHAELGQSVTV